MKPAALLVNVYFDSVSQLLAFNHVIDANSSKGLLMIEGDQNRASSALLGSMEELLQQSNLENIPPESGPNCIEVTITCSLLNDYYEWRKLIINNTPGRILVTIYHVADLAQDESIKSLLDARASFACENGITPSAQYTDSSTLALVDVIGGNRVRHDGITSMDPLAFAHRGALGMIEKSGLLREITFIQGLAPKYGA